MLCVFYEKAEKELFPKRFHFCVHLMSVFECLNLKDLVSNLKGVVAF